MFDERTGKFVMPPSARAACVDEGIDPDAPVDLELVIIDELHVHDDPPAEFKKEIGSFGAEAPDTSREAAVAVYWDTAGDKHRILSMIAQAARLGENLTCDEAEEILGWPHQTVSARFNDLKNLQMIAGTGVKRPTRAGRARLAEGKSATKAEAYTILPNGARYLAIYGEFEDAC